MKKQAKEKELCLFFMSEFDALKAKQVLNENNRRVVPLDKIYPCSYSKMSGHYGMLCINSKVYKVPIRFKLIVFENSLKLLSFEEKQDLKILGGISESWIVQ